MHPLGWTTAMKATVNVQRAPDITKEALDESNPLSEEAVDLFLAIIGAEAGYMGVRALATGGIYICGGITPRVSVLTCCF